MSAFKFNQGTMSNEELEKRSKFWSKKQFRTWSKKELERTSTGMQKLLVAIKEFSVDEIKAIKNLNRHSFGAYYKNDPRYIVWLADQKDLEYAISIAPKNFKVKQG